jgi:serine phosphatase RsbU (regulator of sigma subunit)
VTTMSVHSRAIQSSIAESERIRVAGMLLVLAAAFCLALLRRLVATDFSEARLLERVMLLLASLAVYEGGLLFLARRARSAGNDLPAILWRTNTFVEIGILAAGLAAIGSTPGAQARVVLAPAVAIFFLFVILSSLRLEPILSAAGGLWAAAAYLIATSWNSSDSWLTSSVATAAALLAIGGLLAAGVSYRLRKYLLAALREAETQRELDRIRQDLDTARKIQQGLLPAEPPAIEGFSVAGWNQPADQTGGDYYDWLVLPDGRVVIVLADVSGHGIAPALIAASCRSYARLSFAIDSPLNAHMNRINEQLSADLPSNCFATAVVAILDPKTNQLEFLSAGHGPILHYSQKANAFVNLDSDGIPLGMLRIFKYPESRGLLLEPGDMFISVTDGFFEWTNAEGEQFGIERLKASLHGMRERSPAQMIQALHADVKKFAGGTSQEDDLTAVILTRSGNTASAIRKS